jgi:hypothetical protein
MPLSFFRLCLAVAFRHYPDLEGELMANHFTPEELAEEMGVETGQIIRLCLSEGIPIYKGKIDRSLLWAVMKSKGIRLSQPQAAAS